MPTNKKPMPLEDLPGYFNSVREKGQTGSSPVVDIGRIDTGSNGIGWSKIILGLIVCIGLGFGSFATYDSMSTKEFTLLVDLSENADALNMLPELMSKNGGEILTVSQQEDSTYLVKVSTRKNKRLFLEWLTQNKNVDKVKIKE